MKVIPVINVPEGNEAEVVRLLDIVRTHTDQVHIDVADGTMTGNRSFRDAKKFRELAGSLRIQAHLMVTRPEGIIEDWLAAGADEIVVHLEPLLFPVSEQEESYVIRLQKLREQCQAANAALILGSSHLVPPRPRLTTRAYADAFLVLAVKPGLSGQEMDESATDIVRDLHEAFPEVPIWVDGGVNMQNVPELRAAGASGAVAASAIFSAEDPVAALAALQ